jgi:hypothetical protein
MLRVWSDKVAQFDKVRSKGSECELRTKFWFGSVQNTETHGYASLTF